MIPTFLFMGNKSFGDGGDTFQFHYESDTLALQIEEDTVILEPIDTTSVEINSIFTYMILDNFMADAQSNGLDSAEVNEHINRLDAILIGDLSEHKVLGYTVASEDSTTYTGVRGAILIEEYTLLDWDLFQMTLYHELGHWFGLEHCGCKNEIMMEYNYPRGLNKVYKRWDKKVEHLMLDINSRYNESMSNFDFPDLDHELFVE
ncbi:MAG: putative hydrolase [uncultured marine phage]|uniref:Putative hydrolase n=1 Tax=uncultured marine phage TaxID=707152 RepID=A0A8D9CD90_9VIRU|nr:MAG: putative hydrolase [uncultured marine phage]